MKIELLDQHMIGHWDVSPSITQCEFQFATTLIYVEHAKGQSPAARIALAQQTVQATWDDLPAALTFAEQVSRPQMSEFWTLYAHNQLQGSPLMVYSIHYTLASPSPEYSLSYNPDFPWELEVFAPDDLLHERPIPLERYAPADDVWFSVWRLGAGHFCSQA